MSMRLPRAGLAVALSMLVLTVATSHAQPAPSSNPSPISWPTRPVKLILPLGPGSGVDIGARVLADRLATRWGQSVVIENRPGGDAIVAITAFTSQHDDHTLLMAPTSSFTAHPWLHDKLPYDPRDLVPIARVASAIVAVAVPASSDIKSIADLVAAARARPGKLNWATITGLFDFIFAGFQKKLDLDIAKVPYRDTVQAVNDLGEGRIDVVMSGVTVLQPQFQAGRIRMIAVTARERSSIAPDIPTTTEAGYPDLAIEGLTGIFGPREMPDGLRERIAQDVRAAVTDPAATARLNGAGQMANFGGPKEFSDAVEAQRAQAAAVGALLGIKPAAN